jgi:hypothetical protein
MAGKRTRMAGSRGRTAESRGPMAETQGPTTVDRGLTAVSRGPTCRVPLIGLRTRRRTRICGCRMSCRGLRMRGLVARVGEDKGLRAVGENRAVKAAGRRLGRRTLGGHRAVRAVGARRGVKAVGRNRGEGGRERREGGGLVVGRRLPRVRKGPVGTGAPRGWTGRAAALGRKTSPAIALGHKTGPAVALGHRTGPAAGLRRTGRAAALGRRRMRGRLPRRALGRPTNRVGPADRHRPTTSTAPPRWPARSTSPRVHRNGLPGSGRVADDRPPETRAVSRHPRLLPLPHRHRRRRRRGSRKGGADRVPVSGAWSERRAV